MRALVQRVNCAQVFIDDDTDKTLAGIISGEPNRAIEKGVVVLLGVGHNDCEEDARRLWRKISSLRIFEDDAHKTNLSLAEVNAQALIVSQFTLFADVSHGRRPSFTRSASQEQALSLYRFFCKQVIDTLPSAAFGEFGAAMRIALENEGPFTIWIDTDEL